MTDLTSSTKSSTSATGPSKISIRDFTANKPGTRVILVVEGKELRVNKEVLSFHSNYFNTLLQSPNFKESKSDRINIEHDYDSLVQCMAIAHGTAPVPKGEIKLYIVHNLLQSADFFDLPIVRNYCQSDLYARRQDLARAFILAAHFNLTEVKTFLVKQISQRDACDWMNGPGCILGAPDTYGENLDLTITTGDLRTLMKLANSGRDFTFGRPDPFEEPRRCSERGRGRGHAHF